MRCLSYFLTGALNFTTSLFCHVCLNHKHMILAADKWKQRRGRSQTVSCSASSMSFRPAAGSFDKHSGLVAKRSSVKSRGEETLEPIWVQDVWASINWCWWIWKAPLRIRRQTGGQEVGRYSWIGVCRVCEPSELKWWMWSRQSHKLTPGVSHAFCRF